MEAYHEWDILMKTRVLNNALDTQINCSINYHKLSRYKYYPLFSATVVGITHRAL